MADTLTPPPRLSPFAGLLAETASDSSPGVILTPRILDQVQIDCRPDRAGAIALALPVAGRAVSHEDFRLLSLAPGRWMVIAADRPDLADRIRALIGRVPAAVVDQSHGRATLRLMGPAARDVLAAGTGIDLHPRVFAPDCVASTALFHVPVTIDRRHGTSTFDIHMARGYARSLAERLIGAGRQYGVAVEA